MGTVDFNYLNKSSFGGFTPIDSSRCSNVGNCFNSSPIFGGTAFNNFNFFDSLNSPFSGMDLFSIMIQQQQSLAMLFEKSPNNYSIGLPDFKNMCGMSAGGFRQKVASMPLSKASAAKIATISKKINCNAEDLAALIYAESGGNPKAVNGQSGATGLIQFMPGTAKRFNTSTQELYNMPAEKQLDYVDKYLTAAKNTAVKSGKLNSNAKIDAGTLYTLVFMPAKAGQEVVCTGGKALSQNKGLANNNVITKQTLADRLHQFSGAVRKLFV